TCREVYLIMSSSTRNFGDHEESAAGGTRTKHDIENVSGAKSHGGRVNANTTRARSMRAPAATTTQRSVLPHATALATARLTAPARPTKITGRAADSFSRTGRLRWPARLSTSTSRIA